jgi:hypothetical protein
MLKTAVRQGFQVTIQSTCLQPARQKISVVLFAATLEADSKKNLLDDLFFLKLNRYRFNFFTKLRQQKILNLDSNQKSPTQKSAKPAKTKNSNRRNLNSYDKLIRRKRMHSGIRSGTKSDHKARVKVRKPL